ncbi:MAG TPA: hypothetical protein VLF68_04955 [Candidatus Saccharimonadales bacterium]|nr:hypothetical protein [Candidatus Saccharimonadales bacterium]
MISVVKTDYVLFDSGGQDIGDIVGDTIDQLVGGCFPVLLGLFLFSTAVVIKIYQTVFH